MPMDLSFIDGIDREADYPAEIARNFWIMDNHKWAFWAWEIYRCREDQHLPNTLVHIDYHFDSGNDWQDKRLEELQGIRTCEELLKYVEEGGSGSRIRYDNFIAPGFIRGVINHVDFYCLQTNTEPGLFPPDLERHRCTQTLHDSPGEIAQKNEGKRVLFDLDIDIFNRSDMWCETDHWPDNEVLALLNTCAPLIRDALVVTVAISFGYSGAENDARRLAKVVVGRMLELREA